MRIFDARFVLLAAALLFLARPALALDGTWSQASMETTKVPSPVPLGIYLPPGYDAKRAKPYPLLIQLHGGGGSAEMMATMAPMLEEAIKQGRIEPVVSVMPSAGRSFYMNYRDGSQKWEDFVTEDLIAYMRAHYNVAKGRDGTLITGISMGGMGSLRIAFKHPDLFAGVASMEPGIEPAMSYDDIKPRDSWWRTDTLMQTIYGNPVDKDYWAANNPANIAAADPSRLSDLAIFLDAGDQDMFFLHYGTEYVHRVLFDAGVSHEYHLVRGAEHVGPSLVPRYLDAMTFLGRVLDPPDWVNGRVKTLHFVLDLMKRRAGYPVNDHDPRTMRTK